MKGQRVWFQPEPGVRFSGVIAGRPFECVVQGIKTWVVAVTCLPEAYTRLKLPDWAASRQAAEGTLMQTCPAAPVEQLRMEDGSLLKVWGKQLICKSPAEVPL
ncbi:MAG: hypothetical protein AAGJ19_22080 [Myxococcota bacterium]